MNNGKVRATKQFKLRWKIFNCSRLIATVQSAHIPKYWIQKEGPLETVSHILIVFVIMSYVPLETQFMQSYVCSPSQGFMCRPAFFGAVATVDSNSRSLQANPYPILGIMATCLPDLLHISILDSTHLVKSYQDVWDSMWYRICFTWTCSF